MNKPIRKAVRCFLIKKNKVVVTKYKSGNKKEGYYDIPGGKIEEESPEEAAIREMKEETGLTVTNLKLKGKMKIEYPKKIFDLLIFRAYEFEGRVQEFEDNTSEWIEINELLNKEKKLSNVLLLEKEYINGLIDDKCSFIMNIEVDNNEIIKNIEYKLDRGSKKCQIK